MYISTILECQVVPSVVDSLNSLLC